MYVCIHTHTPTHTHTHIRALKTLRVSILQGQDTNTTMPFFFKCAFVSHVPDNGADNGDTWGRVQGALFEADVDYIRPTNAYK